MSNLSQLDFNVARTQAQSTQQILEKSDQLIQNDQYKTALTGLMPLLQAGNLDPAVLGKAASCYFQLGDTQTAISLVEVIIQTRPDLTAVWGTLAAMKQSLGDQQGAISGYCKVLKKNPNFVPALAALNRLEPFKRNSSKVARLRRLEKSHKLSHSERSLASNVLGQVERALNRPGSAFRFFAKAKALQKRDFLPEAIDHLVDGQIENFHKPVASDCNLGDPRVIFVVGMPRSGTTLVESILARHPMVGSVGESLALTKTLQSVRKHIKASQDKTGGWDWCGRLSQQEISIFRRYYFECISQTSIVNNDVIVDKMPLNALHLGLAHLLLPDAKFIFMSRHPLDVGLSNFSNHYNSGNEFSCRLEWIGQMTRSVYRSIDDYKNKLPDQLRIQSYQGLVTNPESQIRSLLAHVGLDWQQDCLSPQDAKGAIRTASVQQAREEINTRALGKWEAYQDHLQPLVDALGGPTWIENWQALDQRSASV